MRRRGVDFQHRFNASRWAEDLMIRSFGEAFGVVTVRFGISTFVPEGEKLVYGTSKYKEPDLLVFKASELSTEKKQLLADGSLDWNERKKLGGTGLDRLLKRAFGALEIEFSPYQAKEMKERHWKIRTPEQWDARPLKHAKPPTAPNIWIKEEDIEKLSAWESDYGIPIAVAHFFDQEAFAVSLSKVAAFRAEYRTGGVDQKRLQMTSGIFAKLQDYDRVDMQGAGEQKPVYIVTPAAAEKVGDICDVKVGSQVGLSGSKKYVSHVVFTGGQIEISRAFLEFLSNLSQKRQPPAPDSLREVPAATQTSDRLL